MKASWRGHVVAEATSSPPRQLFVFPPTARRVSEARAKTAATCAVRTAYGFYDVSDGESTGRRAAWSYEAPLPAYRHVDHWIGFWEDVELLD
jgi:uncharacterized protein (DUF427 family)